MTGALACAAYALQWWLVLAVLAAAARAVPGDTVPVSAMLRQAAGRWVVVVAVAALPWAIAHAVPWRSTITTRVAALTAVAALALWAGARRAGAARSAGRVETVAPARFLRDELAFVLPYAAYLVLRGFNHDIYGLEKFMDYGFVVATLGSPAMPPPDPWLAGSTINYYYFGHVVAATLIELTGVPPPIGYNLMLATLFGATFQIAGALAGDVATTLAPRAPAIAGGLAALWLTVGGNLHGAVYGLLRPVGVRLGWFDPPAKPYWLSDSTRFVGHDPPTADKLIHEFPAYAFYVGDLHAHLLALPLVLTLLAGLLAWSRMHARGDRRAALAAAAALGAGVATVAMTNAWDGATLGALVGAVVVVATLRREGLAPGAASLARTGVVAAAALALVLAPFAAHFVPFASGLDWVRSRTPAWQWLLLYGAPLALAAVAVAVARPAPGAVAGEADRVASDRAWIVAIACAGLACALVPEIAYVKDIYSRDWYRANTAFKFGFQAFVLLVLAASVGFAALVDFAARARRPGSALAAVELLVIPCLYYGWFFASGALAGAATRPWTLDGQRYLARETPEDYGAIRWLARHARPGESLVEAVGESYTYAARISTHSGVPAVLGWPMHEWLWRGTSGARDALAHEVAALYRDPAGPATAAFLRRAHPTYVIIGRLERERHGPFDAHAVEGLGAVVWRQGMTAIVRIDAVGGGR